MSSGAGILLVGCGKMGSALLQGWLARGVSEIHVVEPAGAPEDLARGRGVAFFPSLESLPAALRPEVVVLAVKPQTMDGVLPGCRRHAESGALVLSIAAGKTIRFFERGLGPAAIVRAMPNTPAAVGRGITVACANARVSAEQRGRADALLAAVGEVAWIGDEALLDAVTALSGGGPAYVFLLIECLAKAGAAAGLPGDLAMRLARATVIGAGELARQSPEPAQRLRENVTSPGGTTVEALKVLMSEDGLETLMRRAIAAATRRARELDGQKPEARNQKPEAT